MANIQKGDIFTANWGYNQTNHNHYTVVDISKTGKTVTITANDNSISDRDIVAGSKVKVYSYERSNDYREEKRNSRKAKENAETVEIIKRTKDGGYYTWILSDGRTVKPGKMSKKTATNVEQVKPLKKCRVKNPDSDEPSIKIDDTRRAYYDPNYEQNRERYKRNRQHAMVAGH